MSQNIATQLHIIIGLGGTGANVLNLLYERVKNDDDRRRSVGMIIFDSDVNSRGNFPEPDFICDSTALDAEEFCRKCLEDNTPFGENFRQYWPGLTINAKDRAQGLGSFVGAGFGASRPKGFLGLIRNLAGDKPILNLIEQKVTQLCAYQNLQANATILNVLLIGSFAGGTGSGTFLDLAYLINNHFSANYRQVRIFGFFLLGRTAMLNRAVALSDVMRDWANANTYGAFWEMIYRLRARSIDKYYLQNVKIQNAGFPFESVMLVDLFNQQGKALTSYKEYEAFLADFIYDMTIRKVTMAGMHTPLENIFSHGSFNLASCGKGVLLYPRKDVIDLFSFYLLRDYIEKDFIPENSSKIREHLERDFQDPLKLALSPYDFLEIEIRGLKYSEALEEKGFPVLPDFMIKKIEKEYNKKNVYEKKEEVKKIFLTDLPKEFEKFRDKILPQLIDNFKEKFPELLRGKESVSFIHGYLQNFITIIKNYIDNAEVRKKDAESKYRTYLDALSDYLKDPDKIIANKKDFIRHLKNYYEELSKWNIYFIKYEFYKECLSFSEKILDSVNIVHNYIKKGDKSEGQTGLLKELRLYINNLETEGSYSKNYPNYAAMKKILSIKDYKDYYEKIYGNFVENKDNLRKIKSYINNFEDGLKKYIFDYIFPEIQKGNVFNASKSTIIKEIIDQALNNLRNVFIDLVPDNIFKALKTECDLKGLNVVENLNKLNHIMINDTAAQYLISETELKRRQINNITLVISNPEEFKNLCIELNKSENDFKPFDINCFDYDSSDEIVYIRAYYSFNEDGLSEFNPPFGTYYRSYEDTINNIDPEKRYNVFTDLRFSPLSASKKLIFLLAEHAGIIKNKLDKKGNETGNYYYRNNILEKNLKGRANVIQWFIQGKNPKVLENILSDLNKWWSSISPENRKGEFEKTKKEIGEKIQNPNLSDYLKEVYKENEETLKNAIEYGLYNVQEFRI